MLKRLQKDYLPLEESWGYHWVDRPLQYYVRSTVLGGAVLSEVNNTGKKLKSYVFAGGQTIAWQAMNHPGQGSPVEMLRFEHYDPAGMSRRMTIENGNATGVEGLESDAAEFDPAGQSVGLWDPYPELPPPFPGEGCIGCGSSGIFGIDDNSTMYVNGQRVSMTLDGARISYSSGMSLLYVGASAVCPNNDCGPRRYQGTWTSPLVAGADGFLEYLAGSPQQTNRPRMSRGKKPMIKPGRKLTRKERKRRQDLNALAATGIFDDENDFTKVDITSSLHDIFVASMQAATLVNKRTSFIGFSDDEVGAIIYKLIKALIWGPCVSAFTDIPGLFSTPEQVLRNRGITFINAPELRFTSIESQVGFTTKQRTNLLSRVDSKLGFFFGIAETTVAPRRGEYLKFPNQRIYVVLNLSSLWSNINEDVFHALIHGGGVVGSPGISGGLTSTHDLSNLGDKYTDLLTECNPL